MTANKITSYIFFNTSKIEFREKLTCLLCHRFKIIQDYTKTEVKEYNPSIQAVVLQGHSDQVHLPVLIWPTKST